MCLHTGWLCLQTIIYTLTAILLVDFKDKYIYNQLLYIFRSQAYKFDAKQDEIRHQWRRQRDK